MSQDDWDHDSQDDTGPGMLGSKGVGHSLSGQALPPAPRFGTEEEPEMTAVEKSWDAMDPPEAWQQGCYSKRMLGNGTWRIASS